MWTAACVTSLIAAAWVAVPSVRAEPVATVDGDPVSVEADRMDIDLKAGRTVLHGQVRIRRGDLSVQCDRVEAEYDDAPAIRWAKATGNVRASYRGLEAKAAEAELVLDRRVLTLRHGVRLRRGGAWMQAKEAAVDLKTNRVTLQKVRGRIPIPSALPRPGASK